MQAQQQARVEALASSLGATLDAAGADGDGREAFARAQAERARSLAACSFGPQLLGVVAGVYAAQAARARGGVQAAGAWVRDKAHGLRSQARVASAAMAVMQAHFEIKRERESAKEDTAGGDS